MTDEILGNNPLEERDSIWKVPEPENSATPPEVKIPEDDLDFPDPLEKVADDEPIVSPVEESPSSEGNEPEESSDYFEIPNYDSEALSDDEQDNLHAEYSEDGEVGEDFMNAVDFEAKTPTVPDPVEDAPEEPVSTQEEEQPAPTVLENVSVQELAPICSDGANTTDLGFDTGFADKLVDQIKETLPRDAESAALYTKFEGYTPAEIPVVVPVVVPEPEPEEVAVPELIMDDKVVTENLANMMTLEDLILDGGVQSSPAVDDSQATMPLTIGDLSGSTPQGVGSMDINAYILNDNLPAAETGMSSDLPAQRDASEFAESTFRKNEEDENERSIEEDSYTSMIQLVGFKLDTEFYGIDIMQIQEIIRLQDVTPVPRSANFILGVLNLRGKVIPIIDLRRRFGLLKAPATSHTRIVIVNIDVGVIGFVVDEVSEVIRIPKSSIEAAPATSTNINAEYIRGVGHLGDHGEELLIILDLNKVLTRERKELVEELM